MTSTGGPFLISDIFDVKGVETADGRFVYARYLQHYSFDAENSLHEDLHRVFITSLSEKSFAAAYALNQAIEAFLDFISKHNPEQPESLRISSLEALNTENFRAFIKYLRKSNLRVENAVFLKAAIHTFADHTPTFRRPILPMVGVEKGPPTEPLSDECFEQLQAALFTEIDRLYQKIAFIQEVEQAVPYTWEEAMAEIFPGKTKANVFKSWEDRSTKNKRLPREAQIRNLLKDCSDAELRNLALSPALNITRDFISIYERDRNLLDTQNVVDDQYKRGLRNWDFDIRRALKTVLMSGYPMKMSLDYIAENYRHDNLIGLDDCKTVQDLFMLRMVRSGTKYKYEEAGGNWDGFLSKYFPSMTDAAALYLMIAVQSGWNKETVFALDSENFEHALAGVLHESQTLIYSEKNRSQGTKLPYSDPKQFLAPSNRDDKYSIYNIIQLCKKISAPLHGYEFDFMHAYHDESDLNPLFLCIRYWADWVSKGGRHTSLSQNKAFSTGIAHFLKKNGISENGKPLSRPSDITLKTRVTWINQKRKTLPLSVMRLIQGHESEDTTDVFYDSSGIAMQARKILLRDELEDITRLLRARKFEGLVSSNTDHKVTASLRVFHIPSHEKDLWGCSDQYRPTWRGHDLYVGKGAKCSKISKCIFCQQVRLFDDSVPYLLTRLDQLIDAFNIDEKNDSDLAQEYEIIRGILDGWDDDDLMKESTRFIRRNPSLLPSDLNDLQIIFEDEEIA